MNNRSDDNFYCLCDKLFSYAFLFNNYFLRHNRTKSKYVQDTSGLNL